MDEDLKVSRRQFMKISGVVAGGAMTASGCLRLSNLTTSEKGRETERGEWKHTACAMCLMCPMQAKVKKGKIVDVKGEGILPWDGKICAKAYGGIWGRVYAPDRILHPLKRVGKRGEGKFVRCSWEEVINAVANKIKKYREEGNPEAFETWWGCPVQTDNMYFLHYFARITGTGISYMHGQICFGDHSAEKAVSFGSNHMGPLMTGCADYMNTKYAVIAAQNFPGTVFAPGTAFGSAAFYQLFLKARENGFQYTTVDPKLGDSAAMADDWLPIKPGSDGAFAMAVANILIKEKLYDEDFLLNFTNAPQLIRADNLAAVKDEKNRYLTWNIKTQSAVPMGAAGEATDITLGNGESFSVDGVACKTALQLFAEEAAKFPADQAAKICNIPYSGDRIEQIAFRLGNNKPAVLFYPGFTTGRYSNWFQVLRAYSTVNMLLGNFEKPGGWYFPKHGFSGGTGWPEPPEVPEYPNPGLKVVPAPWGNKMSITSRDKAPCYSSPREFHPATQALPWEHFGDMKKGKLKALFSTAENSAITQVDTALVYECIDKLELIIVGEQVPKEFVELADYVIPEASYVERNHLYSFTALAQDGQEHAMALMRSAAIPAVGESKPVSWFLTEVGKKLGLGPYFANLDLQYGWWDRILKKANVPVDSRHIVKNGPYVESFALNYDMRIKPIDTRSGRFEMYSNDLSEECYNNSKSRWHQSVYVHPIPLNIPIAGPKADDEFYLVSGKASWHQKNATQNNRVLMEDGIEGGCPYTPLYLNSDRAGKLGLKEGDEVEIQCVGPTKAEDPCVDDDSVLGYKQTLRIHLTEALQPDTAWTHFAAGHRSKLMLKKVTEGVLHSAFVPLSIEPYAGGCGKNYSIVKLTKKEG